VEASNEQQSDWRMSAHAYGWCTDSPEPLAGDKAGRLPTAAGVCAPISASGTVGGSMLRAKLRLQGVRACSGALAARVRHYALESANLTPSTPHRATLRIASSAHLLLRMQPK